MEMVEKLVDKSIEWIDHLFGYGDEYSKGYSNFIVYGGLLFIASKIFKVKLNINTGGKKK